MTTLTTVARDLSNVVDRIARDCPQAALLAILQTPELLEDWTDYAGGADNLQSIAISLYVTLPCTCGSAR